MIRLFKVKMARSAKKLVNEVLSSGFIGQGPKVDLFEQKLKEALGTKGTPVTVNSCTSAIDLALELCGVDSDSEVITVPVTCVSSNTPVLLADGTTRSMGDLVDNKEAVEVVSLNTSTGQLEPKKITNWIKHPSTEQWYKLAIKKLLSKDDSNIFHQGVWLTADHQVLTKDRSWQRVDSLIESDKIATQYEEYTSLQKSFADGLILSDGCIQTNKGYGSRLSTAFVHDKAELASLAKNLLGGLLYPRPQRNQSQEALAYQSSVHPFWMKQKHRWYPTKSKIVPDDLVLTPETLAVWYMGDGSLGRDENGNPSKIVFCTDSFDIQSFWKLFYKMVDLGFKPTSIKSPNNKGNRICLGLVNSDIDKFLSMISSFILPCFRYKVPEGYTEYNPENWIIKTPREVHYAEYLLKQEKPPSYVKPKYVYCIQVEDNQNFIAWNMVLHNCYASNCHILHRGAKIRWADVQEGTWLIDPKSVERLITPKTKAIIAVNWAGKPCDYKALKKFGIPVIEDAAHCWDYFSQHQKLERGDYICYSFQAIKFLTTSDGGCLITNDPEKEKLARLLRWYGLDRTLGQSFRCAQDLKHNGYKYHMNDVCAAIGLANLSEAKLSVKKHRKHANYLINNITNPFLSLPVFDDKCSYWLMSISVLTQNVDEFIAYMAKNGVEANPVHYRNDRYTITKPFIEKDLPGVEQFAKQQVSIPVGWWLNKEDLNKIVEVCNNWNPV